MTSISLKSDGILTGTQKRVAALAHEGFSNKQIAQKLGFTRAIVPEAARAEAPDGFSLSTIGTLANLVADIARDGVPALRRVGGQES